MKNTTLHKVLAAAPTIRWQHTPSSGVNHMPHNCTLTPQLYERIVALFRDNLTRYQTGQPLRILAAKYCQSEQHPSEP